MTTELVIKEKLANLVTGMLAKGFVATTSAEVTTMRGVGGQKRVLQLLPRDLPEGKVQGFRGSAGPLGYGRGIQIGKNAVKMNR